MKKNLKRVIVLLIILISMILLDTLQAKIFTHSPIISFRQKLESEYNWVDRGFLIDAYYCKGEDNTVIVYLEKKKNKFTCPIYSKEEINENLININELNTYIKKLSYSNFEYDYNITINEYNYIYDGIKYDDLYKGNYKDKKSQIQYQIENKTCYDLFTKKEIFNPHYNVNISYIDLNYLSEILDNESTKCIRNEHEFKCNTINNNIEIELKFNIENDTIERINITDNNDFEYSMQYTNIDNVNNIERLIDFHVNSELFFEETTEIISEEIENFGIITFYNISKVKFIDRNKNKYQIRKELLDSTTLETFLKLALFKVEKNNSTKYIYKNNFIIYVHKNADEQQNVYISLEKYNNEILEKLQAIN